MPPDPDSAEARVERALRDLRLDEARALVGELPERRAALVRAVLLRYDAVPGVVDALLALGEGHDAVAARAATELAWALRSQGKIAEATGAADHAIRVSEALGERALATVARCLRAELAALAGAHAEADRFLADAEALAPVEAGARLHATRANLARSRGRTEDLLAEATALLATATERGLRFDAHRSLLEAHLAAGRTAEALHHARAAAAELPSDGPARLRGLAALMLGEAARAAGELAEARAAYAIAEATFPPRDVQRAYARLNQAQCAADTGRWDEAATLADPLRPLFASRPAALAVAALLGVPAAAAAGDLREVDAALAQALGRGSPTPDLGRLAERVADALADDPPREARVRAEAVETWEALGNATARDRAIDALRRGRRTGDAPVVLGPWLLEQRIGHGGVAQVWAGRHADTGERAAVKVLRDGGLHPEVRVQLLRELRVLASLDHPHVLGIRDHGRVGVAASAAEPSLPIGAPWLVTDLCTGGSLADRAGALPWEEVLRLSRETLAGLAHVHARGLLHLDVKPGNVLLHGDPQRPEARLADFGLAVAGGAERRRVAGTPAYMAPEQRLREGPPLGPWTDLYAFGGLLVTLVTGAPPGATGTAGTGPRLPLTRIAVPGGLEDLLGALLARDPEHRPARAAEVAARLAALGPPDRPAGAPLGRGRASPTHTVDPDAPELPMPPAATGGSTGGAPTPASARRGRRAASAALVGLRIPPTSGREREREQLWAAWRRARQGRSTRVWVRGPAGSGARHLARDLAWRVAESGGTGLWFGPDDDLDPDELRAELRRAGPALVAVGWPHQVDPDDALALAVAGLPVTVVLAAPADAPDPPGPAPDLALSLGPHDDLAALLDGWVPLTPGLRSAVVGVADGLPGRAVGLVRRLAADRLLEPTRAGLALLPGVPLPDAAAPAPAAAREAHARLRAAGGALPLPELETAIGAPALERLVREGWLRVTGTSVRAAAP